MLGVHDDINSDMLVYLLKDTIGAVWIVFRKEQKING
jgi:hypothetical protein